MSLEILPVKKIYFWILTGTFVILGIHAFINPYLLYGDAYSDANTIIGAENLVHHGFGPSYGIPFFGSRDSYQTCIDKGVVCADSHYPGLPYWVNSIWQMLGIESLVFYRLFSLFLSLGFALMLPAFFQSFQINKNESFLASSLVLLHPFFVSYADSIHQFPYNYIFLAGFVLSLNHFFKYSNPKWAASAALFFFLSTFTSFEYFLYYPVTACCLWLAKPHRTRRNFGFIFAICSVPVFTLALRLYHQSFLWGGFQAAYDDLFHAASYRSDVTFLQMLYHFQKRFFDFHLPLVPGLLFLFYWAGRKKDMVGSPLLRACGILFLAAFSWWVSMKQHAMVHSHVSLLWLPFYGALGALIIKSLLEWQNEAEYMIKISAKALIGLLVLVAALRVGSGPQLNMLFPLWKKEHQILTRSKADVLQVLEWIQSYKPERIYIDSETRGIAYHSKMAFEYANPADMCKDNSVPYIVPEPTLAPEKLQQCIDVYSRLQRTAGLIIFSKPK